MTILQTTTSTLQGQKIERYLGIVTGETILGVNVIKDIFANLSDFFGGRSGTYEKELATARETAFREMEGRALELGANAIIGIDIDYETVGSKGGMLMVSVCGTAVRAAAE